MAPLLALLCAMCAAMTTTHAFAPPDRGTIARPPPRRSPTSLFSSTSSLPDGLTKTVTEPGNGETLRPGDVATVRYSCYVPGGEGSGPSAPFARSRSQKVVVGDGTMIRGWDLALRTMEVGERATVRVRDADSFGYGEAGVPPFVPPNSEIEMDVRVLDSEPGVDLGTLATSDPLKPRTPGAIADAYKTRQDRRAEIDATAERKEGLDALIEKARTFYFFGFFEGETGERPPWFLRPSITFPLAFLIVGATFYVSYVTGAITERGAQVTDELDEIIVRTDVLRSGIVLAFASMTTMTLQF